MEEEKRLTPDQLHEIKNTMEGVVAPMEGANQVDEMSEMLIRLLALEDDEFSILAPGIMQAYQQSLNNPNDKIGLAQAVNASGSSAEDLIEFFETFQKEVEKLPLSAIKRDFINELIASTINSINETEGIAKRMINVPIELCHPDAKIPQYAHISDSGMDIYALEDITIKPGETVLVPTGIKVALPPGYELQVRPKSGRCVKTKLRIANTPGTIDQGYRDEIKVIIENVAPPIMDIQYEFVTDPDVYCKIKSIATGPSYTIGKGEKFAQLVLAETPKVSFYRVDSVQDIGEDRGGGFGSTGLK